MVYIKSEESIKNDLEILKLLNLKIIAISKHPTSITAAYEDGTLRIIKSFGILSVSKFEAPSIIQKDPWLEFQVLINNNILLIDGVEQFCHKVDDFIFQANDMTLHKKFKIYFPFSDEWEVEIEII